MDSGDESKTSFSQVIEGLFKKKQHINSNITSFISVLYSYSDENYTHSTRNTVTNFSLTLLKDHKLRSMIKKFLGLEKRRMAIFFIS